MSRLEGLDDRSAGIGGRAIFSAARRIVGDVPEPMRLMAHQPWILRANAGFEFGLSKADALDPVLKGLVAIKVASMVGCVF